MSKKRKRAETTSSKNTKLKRTCLDTSKPSQVDHPTLRLFYTSTQTLRDWLLLHLPSSASKSRLRKVASAGLETPERCARGDGLATSSQSVEYLPELAILLDRTLICPQPAANSEAKYLDEQELIRYTQRLTSTRTSSIDDCSLFQSDVSQNLFVRSHDQFYYSICLCFLFRSGEQLSHIFDYRK